MTSFVYDDICNATEDIICHQVNCYGVMNAGVAKDICTRWPSVKSEYLKLCAYTATPKSRLGFVQYVIVNPDTQQKVANIFGQLDYGRDRTKRYTDYSAVEKAFCAIQKDCQGLSLAFPYGFGCGLANGDWNLIRFLIEQHFGNMRVAIYDKYLGGKR